MKRVVSLWFKYYMNTFCRFRSTVAMKNLNNRWEDLKRRTWRSLRWRKVEMQRGMPLEKELMVTLTHTHTHTHKGRPAIGQAPMTSHDPTSGVQGRRWLAGRPWKWIQVGHANERAAAPYANEPAIRTATKYGASPTSPQNDSITRASLRFTRRRTKGRFLIGSSSISRQPIGESSSVSRHAPRASCRKRSNQNNSPVQGLSQVGPRINVKKNTSLHFLEPRATNRAKGWCKGWQSRFDTPERMTGIPEIPEIRKNLLAFRDY